MNNAVGYFAIMNYKTGFIIFQQYYNIIGSILEIANKLLIISCEISGM